MPVAPHVALLIRDAPRSMRLSRSSNRIDAALRFIAGVVVAAPLIGKNPADVGMV